LSVYVVGLRIAYNIEARMFEKQRNNLLIKYVLVLILKAGMEMAFPLHGVYVNVKKTLGENV
jgi:hypothetical protein